MQPEESKFNVDEFNALMSTIDRNLKEVSKRLNFEEVKQFSTKQGGDKNELYDSIDTITKKENK